MASLECRKKTNESLQRERERKEKERRWQEIQSELQRVACGIPMRTTGNHAIRVGGIVDIFPFNRRICWIKKNQWEDLGTVASLVALVRAKLEAIGNAR